MNQATRKVSDLPNTQYLVALTTQATSELDVLLWGC